MNFYRILIVSGSLQASAVLLYVLLRSVQTFADAEAEGVKGLAMVASAVTVLAIVATGYMALTGLGSVSDLERIIEAWPM